MWLMGRRDDVGEKKGKKKEGERGNSFWKANAPVVGNMGCEGSIVLRAWYLTGSTRHGTACGGDEADQEG